MIITIQTLLDFFKSMYNFLVNVINYKINGTPVLFYVFGIGVGVWVVVKIVQALT